MRDRDYRYWTGRRMAFVSVMSITALAGLSMLNHRLTATLTDDPTAQGGISESSAGVAAATAPSIAPEAPKAGQQRLPDQMFADNPQATSARVRRLVRETGGDWNKLSPNDQRMMDAMSMGHGREMLKGLAETMKKQETVRATEAAGGAGRSQR